MLWCNYQALKNEYRILRKDFKKTKYTQDFESKEFKVAFERAFLLSRSIVAAHHIDVFRTAKKCATLELEMTVVKYRLEYFKMVLKDIKRDISIPIQSISKRDSIPLDLYCNFEQREKLKSSKLENQSAGSGLDDNDDLKDVKDIDLSNPKKTWKDAIQLLRKENEAVYNASKAQSQKNLKNYLNEEKEKETEEIMKKNDEYMAKRRTTYETIQEMIRVVISNIRDCLSIPELENLPMKMPTIAVKS